jgi:hypothetical protein
VKRQHNIYHDSDINDILKHLSAPDLERGVIARIPQDTGIPDVALPDWHCHRTDLVVTTTEANDIELLFVPTGATGGFQPLDRRIFGELKVRARAEFGRPMWVMCESGVGYDESAEILIRCWNAIPIQDVQKAWDII